MKNNVFLIFILLLAFFITGCYPHPSDIGRVDNNSYEAKKQTQEELIARQQEIIERQQREIKNTERQRYYNQQLERYIPQE